MADLLYPHLVPTSLERRHFFMLTVFTNWMSKTLVNFSMMKKFWFLFFLGETVKIRKMAPNQQQWTHRGIHSWSTGRGPVPWHSGSRGKSHPWWRPPSSSEPSQCLRIISPSQRVLFYGARYGKKKKPMAITCSWSRNYVRGKILNWRHASSTSIFRAIIENNFTGWICHKKGSFKWTSELWSTIF